jgi:four helix bundle protein
MKSNTIRSDKDLVVWQKGISFGELAYQLTKNFPSEEKFGLVAQMRRAAMSVPPNIAEGQARHTTGEFIQFISHPEGSVAELETPAFELAGEIHRMLNALRQKLAARQ